MVRNNDVIQKAIRYLEDNLKEDIFVDDIAKESAYSISHFTRLFMEHTGDTPGAYLRKRRLEEAAHDILAGKKILDAALDYHFGSQESFTRSFKLHYNVTPGFYVKLGVDMRAGISGRSKEVHMAKRMEGLRWQGRWNTLLGCIKGCLDYLKLDLSDAWLYGATGYAFVMNMRETQACGSSPDTWVKQQIFELGKNIGFETNTVFAVESLQSEEDFDKKLNEAWDMAREAIDRDVPCFGWEVGYPGYQLIVGYDDTGYYYSGPDDMGKGHKLWKKLGETELSAGVIEMHAIRPGQGVDDAKIVKGALEFALEHAQGPDNWILPGYRAGLAGYDMWIKAVENRTALTEGMAYNSAFWSECRGLGSQFLREAGERLSSDPKALLTEAAEQYAIISQHLENLSELYPFTQDVGSVNGEQCWKALGCLQNAREAEKTALELLEKIVHVL